MIWKKRIYPLPVLGEGGRKNDSFFCRVRVALTLLLCFSFPVYSAETAVILDKAPIDITDSASLQRGARLFMNYCSGCHSLKFSRYNSIAQGIGITDESGELLEEAVKRNLLFTGDKLSDPIQTAMPLAESADWFGQPPPDLTLVARLRGKDWLYTYLRSFYPDANKTWGVNNHVFPDVGMPHVLEPLQTRLSEEEYDETVADLVNFLSYVGEPIQVERQKLGVWVLLFLSVFLVLAYLLYREYWKDIKK